MTKYSRSINVISFFKWGYYLSILCLFLQTFYFKFFWGLHSSLFLLISFIMWFVMNMERKIYANKDDLISIFVLFLIIMLQVFSNSGEGIVGQALLALVMAQLVLTEQNDKYTILRMITIVFAAICLISLIGWVVVCILNVSMPMQIVTFQSYRFYDYGIFNIRVEGIEFSRYLGMFIEPGYTGVMCVLLLIANNLNLKKKETIILLICLLATLSLAAYLLLFIYILVDKFSVRSIGTTVVTILIVFSVIYVIHKTVYDLSWIYDYFLRSRMEALFTENLLGDRFSDRFNDFYEKDILLIPWNALFGVGSVRYIELANAYYFKSAGYKVYIAQFGLLNTSLTIFFYYFNINRHFTKKGFIVFLIWFFSFVDMAYPTWAAFLIYVICIDSFMRKANIVSDNIVIQEKNIGGRTEDA